MGDDPGPQPNAFELLYAFLGATSAEDLRHRHCAHCGRIGKANVAQRSCMSSRCGLLDGETFQLEQQFIAACRPLLSDPDGAHLDEMEAFNWYLHAAGCVSPALRPGPHGFWERGVMSGPTMRGLLHAALFTFLAKQAGDYLSTNVGMTQREILKDWSERRESQERGDAWEAAQLKDAQLTIAEICERLGRRGKPIAPNTARRLIRQGRPRLGGSI